MEPVGQGPHRIDNVKESKKMGMVGSIQGGNRQSQSLFGEGSTRATWYVLDKELGRRELFPLVIPFFLHPGMPSR